MSSLRTLGVYRNPLGTTLLRLAFRFGLFVLLATGHLVVSFTEQVMYSGQRWVAVILAALVWGLVFWMVWGARMERVVLFQEGLGFSWGKAQSFLPWEAVKYYELKADSALTFLEQVQQFLTQAPDNPRVRFSHGPARLQFTLYTHEGTPFTFDSNLARFEELANQVLDQLDPLLTERCLEMLRTGETLHFNPWCQLTSQVLKLTSGRSLPLMDISDARALDGRVFLQVDEKWIELGTPPSAYALCELLRVLHAQVRLPGRAQVLN